MWNGVHKKHKTWKIRWPSVWFFIFLPIVSSIPEKYYRMQFTGVEDFKTGVIPKAQLICSVQRSGTSFRNPAVTRPWSSGPRTFNIVILLVQIFTKARIWFTRSKIWNNFLKRRLLISSTLIRIYYRNNVLRSHKSMCWKFSPSKLSGTETKRRNNIRVAWCWMNSHFRWAWGLLAEQTVFHLGIDEIFHSLRKHSAWSHINFPLARTSAFRGRDWIP